MATCQKGGHLLGYASQWVSGSWPGSTYIRDVSIYVGKLVSLPKWIFHASWGWSPLTIIWGRHDFFRYITGFCQWMEFPEKIHRNGAVLQGDTDLFGVLPQGFWGVLVYGRPKNDDWFLDSKNGSMDALWIVYDWFMDALWMLYGCFMDSLWLVYGCFMDALWMLYGCFMDALWMLYGCFVVALWRVYGWFMGG